MSVSHAQPTALVLINGGIIAIDELKPYGVVVGAGVGFVWPAGMLFVAAVAPNGIAAGIVYPGDRLTHVNGVPIAPLSPGP